MSVIYLFRHGQAGTRNDYDKLSALGHEQARLLGEYLAGQGIAFSAAVSGGMRRQRETAQHTVDAFARAGAAFPEVTQDLRWNEFSLSRVYREIGPLLAKDDPEFARGYAEMMAAYTDLDAPFHRLSTTLDATVVRAWIEERYEYGGESWKAFKARVTAALTDLRERTREGPVAVFTSATPTGISLGEALGLEETHRARLAGVAYNSSISALRVRGDALLLFQFNGVPHLPDQAMRSFR